MERTIKAFAAVVGFIALMLFLFVGCERIDAGAIEAEAKKKVAAAEGEAQALKIKGDAEAEYNRKLAASLSSLIVQQNMIKAWDGKLPTLYGGEGVLLDASKYIK